jgi:hypothetical protein
MKLAFVFCAALGFSTFAGTTAVHKLPDINLQQDVAISVPAWLKLPDSEFVSSIEYSGDPGAESHRGAVTLELPSDGQSELAWLMAHFRAHGYQIEDRTSSLDQFGGPAGFVTAVDEVSGRSLSLVVEPRADGAILRITFEEPEYNPAV